MYIYIFLLSEPLPKIVVFDADGGQVLRVDIGQLSQVFIFNAMWGYCGFAPKY